MGAFVGRLIVLTGLVAAMVGGGVTPGWAESVLTRGNGAEPSTLDPHSTDGRSESNIFRDLFEGLVVYGPSGQILPGVAEAWELSDDSTVYTFHLRADAKWSDGGALTAEDFAYSLRRAVAPRPGSEPAANLAVIRNADAVMKGEKPATELGVEAVDPRTLKITLRGPTPYFLALLSSDNSALPVNRAAVEAGGAHWAEPGTLVSNGPYQLVDRKSVV